MLMKFIGGYPWYIGPIHEFVETYLGVPTTNKYFITSRNFVVFRVVEILVISVISALLPFFSDVLSFNILCRFAAGS